MKGGGLNISLAMGSVSHAVTNFILNKNTMKKPTIKFSHRYIKLPEDREATLLAVFETDFKEIGDEMRHYDTMYLGDDDEIGYYKLPKSGKCLVLVFEAIHVDAIFTTIRSAWPPHKIKYYKDRIGEVFNVKVEKKS